MYHTLDLGLRNVYYVFFYIDIDMIIQKAGSVVLSVYKISVFRPLSLKPV